MKTAMRRTGLSDWGGDSFRLPLQRLLASLHEAEPVPFIPRLWFHLMILGSLINRLRIQAVLKRYPEIAEVPIRRPIFIIGAARTGTTYLHRLLAQDPASRALRYWELREPSASPDRQSIERGARSGKHEVAERLLATLLFTHSQREALESVHSVAPDDPEECEYLFMNSFMSFTVATLAAAVSRSLDYVQWLHSQDRVWAYEEHRRQVQLLVWRSPGKRVVLKCPAHLWAIEALLKVYPDASLIWTHRDPAKQVASTCNNLALWMLLFLDEPYDLEKVGSLLIDDLDKAIVRALEVRASSDSARFCDLLYDDLVQDPIEAVRGLYSHFDYEFSAEAERAMRSWLASKQRKKRRRNLYSAEDFGLTTREIRDRLAYYREQFGIPVERT